MHERLYRSRDERVLFGVCGGIAERFDLDPSIVRIGFALLGLSGGVGLVVYIVMALVVPEETEDDLGFNAPVTPGGGGSEPGSGAHVDAATPETADHAAPQPSAAPAGTAAMGAAAMGAAPMTQPMTRREQRRTSRSARRARGDDRGAMVIGAILVIVGTWFLLRRYLPAFTDDFFGPLVLIGLGLVVLVGALGRSTRGDSSGPR